MPIARDGLATTSNRLLHFATVQPITFRNWEIVIEFKIDGHRKDLFGDGMAFWYVKHPLRPGNVFGHEDQFEGLGIFFDTYANQNGAHNHAHPYISAMVNNGTLRYDHDTDGSHYQVGQPTAAQWTS